MKTKISLPLLLALASPLSAQTRATQTPGAIDGAPAAPTPVPPVGVDGSQGALTQGARMPGADATSGAGKAAGAGGGVNLEELLAARPLVNRMVTPAEAVAIALRESPVLRGAEEEVEAALGRLNGARAQRRPMLSANTFLSGGSIANIVESPELPVARMIMNLPQGGYFDQNLMLMMPVYTAGRLRTLVRQAAAARGAAQVQLEGQRQEVALLARVAYREVQARRTLAEVQRARLRENEERLRVDRARLAQEQIPLFYVLRDEAEVAATQQELTNAERDVQLSLLQLKTVMGVNPASNIDVTGTLDYQPSADLFARLAGASTTGLGPTRTAAPQSIGDDGTSAPTTGSTAPSVTAGGVTAGGSTTLGAAAIPSDLSALLRLAQRQRTELQAAGFQVAVAQAEADVTGASYRPQVNAFVMGDIAKSQGQRTSAGTTFGIAASIPLYTGGRRRAAMQTAQAEFRRQQRERERLALQVAQEVNTVYLNLRAAEQNILTARAALRSAQEDYRVALVRYQAGRSIVAEVLDALAARTRAESNLVQALFGFNVGSDQLLRAVGQLDAPAASPSTTPQPASGAPQPAMPTPRSGSVGEQEAAR